MVSLIAQNHYLDIILEPKTKSTFAPRVFLQSLVTNTGPVNRSGLLAIFRHFHQFHDGIRRRPKHSRRFYDLDCFVTGVLRRGIRTGWYFYRYYQNSRDAKLDVFCRVSLDYHPYHQLRIACLSLDMAGHERFHVE